MNTTSINIFSLAFVKKAALLASGTLLASNLYADSLLGIYAGAGIWQQNYDGSVRDLDSLGLVGTEIDFENDLGLDDEDGNVFYIALEHGVPGLPNIKLQHTELEIDANNTLSMPIEFGDQSFSIADDIATEADLTHTDLTLYYQLLDNWVSLDLGLTVRFFDGFVDISSSTASAREEFEAPVPLLYLATRFDLPLSGLYAGVSINALGDGDNNLVDYQAALGYESDFGLGIEGGYRGLNLDLDDVDDIEVDLTIDGAFFSLFYHF